MKMRESQENSLSASAYNYLTILIDLPFTFTRYIPFGKWLTETGSLGATVCFNTVLPEVSLTVIGVMPSIPLMRKLSVTGLG
jgi:hypothetical protein